MKPEFVSVLVGEGTLLAACADILLEKGHAISGVVSADSAIERWAVERHVPVASPFEVESCLRRQPFDYLFSIANLSIIPEDQLRLPRRGAINFHDALLPRYAGLHATSWALMNREPWHGITWHEMTTRADAGGILKQSSFPVAPDETAFTLNAKCYEAAIAAFAELVDDLAAGSATSQPQDLNQRLYCRKDKRPVAASVIGWNAEAVDIDAVVRALTFGPYANPLGAPKFAVDEGHFVLVNGIEKTDSASGHPPGTIAKIDEAGITVCTRTQDVIVRSIATIDGEPLSLADFIRRFGLHTGATLPILEPALLDRLTALDRAFSRHEHYWAERLVTLQPLSLPFGSASNDTALPHPRRVQTSVPSRVLALIAAMSPDPRDFILATFGAFLARVGELDCFDIGLADAAATRDIAGLFGLYASTVPFRVDVKVSDSIAASILSTRTQVELVRQRTTYSRDLMVRHPARTLPSEVAVPPRLPICVISGDSAEIQPDPDCQLTLRISDDASRCEWTYRPDRLSGDAVDSLVRQFMIFLEGAASAPDESIGALPRVSSEERQTLVAEWNATSRTYPRDQCIHHQFEMQVQRTPDSVALVFGRHQLTYGELNRRANQVAHRLQAMGVGAETLVGVCLERSLDLVVALLGILKAGGAYVPLDPNYPTERLALMLADAQPSVVVTDRRLAASVGAANAKVLMIDAEPAVPQGDHVGNPDSGVTSQNLAYVMFTSGSTGRPKGVMIAHRSVINFFCGMDERIGGHAPGTWLAVTSICFDISVQELFWPLARGYKVVLHAGDENTLAAVARRTLRDDRPVDFSLFYFASEESDEKDKYRLLLEGARFADQHGFAAVWTPERHFHPFGGLYPNPSVIGAALAVATEHIQIRAGSVVLPLHSPVRVAEEWSVVDNLSHGRVGVSFASGWQANDFVFKPDNYRDRKNLMFRDIDTVRRLWRGEPMSFTGGDGQPVPVRIFPRPVQSELPIWITAAGSPETFRLAGEMGANILTHLLGQNLADLARKIEIYRDAWRTHGHGSGGGRVTVMLHTFVGPDTDEVREVVRRPFSKYLRSSVDLIKNAPAAFPTFPAPSTTVAKLLEQSLNEISETDMEVLLAFAFDRYFETSGLFGSPDRCLEMVEQLKAIGTDEIACLIDFGVDTETVMSSFRHLDEVRARSNRSAHTPAESLPDLIRRHHVSHLQCTPSLARLLAADADSLQALASLRAILIGGEALPSSLVAELDAAGCEEIHNMYGPTETTIWSTSCRLRNTPEQISIGRPLTNTELFILDRSFGLVPPGTPGELFIGGEGLARGYLHQPELTAASFVPNPFSSEPNARLYRTGDLARYLPDGSVEFLGRVDQQVKIRGFRVELGEVEAALTQHPSVRETAVVVREDTPGDRQLVAYVVPVNGAVESVSLRAFLQSKLPDPMVPSVFVTLDALPRTLNGKTNRRSLPAPKPTSSAGDSGGNYLAPQGDLEEQIASVWKEALNTERIGSQDNFFDLGAHSLLMVQVHRKLQSVLREPISLIHLFQYPTVASLALHLRRRPDAKTQELHGVDRASVRLQSQARRQHVRTLDVR